MQNGGDDALSKPRERKIIFLLCVLAAFHVFIFSAAWPLINNIDEYAHFDLAVKYSHGHIPRRIAPISREAMEYIVLYGSQEFLWPPETFPEKKFPPPPWTQSPEKIAPILLAREARWQGPNHESSQPPLYYTVAGIWWDLGKWLGFENGWRLYWLRFLDIVFVVALVWLAYAAARLIFPGNFFLRVGVPALPAFMPQTGFYSIQNDVLSPLCFGAAFVCLVKLLRTENPDVRLGIATGIALAATFLTKLTNLPLLALAFAATVFKIFQLAKANQLRAALPSFAALFFCAALPMIGWLAWCKINFGDLTGSAAKMQLLHWTPKPFSQWFDHPIFSPHGFWIFLSGNLAELWQGSFYWHGVKFSWPTLNWIYVLASIAMLIVALANCLPRFSTAEKSQRHALAFGFLCFAASLSFLAFISIKYDFTGSPSPTPQMPYLISGRMLFGALIPFLLLFVFGIDHALKRFGNVAKFSALAIFILFMLATETALDWPVFHSQYNWFHM